MLSTSYSTLPLFRKKNEFNGQLIRAVIYGRMRIIERYITRVEGNKYDVAVGGMDGV